MHTILDCNNLWSPTGGGVRRYHLEKMREFERRKTHRYVFLNPGPPGQPMAGLPDSSPYVQFETVPSFAQPGAGDYRFVYQANAIAAAIDKYQVDVIEVGSPYLLPDLVHRALAKLPPTRRPVVVGFWHADYPRTYVHRSVARLSKRAAKLAEDAAWAWARRTYGRFDAVFVASQWIGQRMFKRGLDRLFWTPLGVDTQRFDRRHRSQELRQSWLRGCDPSRPILFFPHRLQQEKGIVNLMSAYQNLHTRGQAPVLVIAGDGPDKSKVQAFAKRFDDVHYVGYLKDAQELSAHYASADLSVSLSAFETFGLSTAESMASGLALVAANQGGAAELVEASGCGLTVPYNDSEALTQALAQLLSNPKNLRELGDKGARYAQELSWSHTIERQLIAHQRLLAKRDQGRRLEPGFYLRASLSSHTQRGTSIPPLAPSQEAANAPSTREPSLEPDTKAPGGGQSAG